MSQSLSRLYVHIVFSTKDRQPLIDRSWREQLFGYLAGASNAINCPAIQVGGVADHIHALVDLHRTVTASKLVETLKVESSKWVKREQRLTSFSWQNGFGAFSTDASNRDKVVAYIQNQESHHAHRTFQDEFRTLLQRYDVAYDERYVWG